MCERSCPAARVQDAHEWLEIAQQDIEVMQLCHKNGHYGAAAYHCQQALEKIVKFAVAKYGLVDDPAELNHDILRRLLKKWAKEDPPGEGWPADAIRESHMLLDKVGTSSRSAGKGGNSASGDDTPTVRDCLWADSLGMPVSNPTLDEFHARINPPPISLLRKFLVRYFPKKVGKKILKKVRKKMAKNDKDAAIREAYHACATILWEGFQRMHKPHAGHKRLDREKAEACLLLWVQANLYTLLKVIPHEEYGRYPGTWSGKSRSKCYSEKSDVLLKLEESVCEAFWELHRMIRY